MPVPKKRRSTMKSRHKHATWKVKLPAVAKCTECGAPNLPHHICSACGFYRGEYFKKPVKAKKSKK